MTSTHLPMDTMNATSQPKDATTRTQNVDDPTLQDAETKKDSFPPLQLPCLGSILTGLSPPSEVINSLVAQPGGCGPTIFALSSMRNNGLMTPLYVPWGDTKWIGKPSPFPGRNVQAAAIAGEWTCVAAGRDVILSTSTRTITKRVRYDVTSLSLAILPPTTSHNSNKLLLALAGPRGVQIQTLSIHDGSSDMVTSLVQGYAIRLVAFFPNYDNLLVLTCTGHLGIWPVANLLTAGELKTAIWTTILTCTLVTGVSFSSRGDVFVLSTWEDAPKTPCALVFRRHSLHNDDTFQLVSQFSEFISKSIPLQSTNKSDTLPNPSLCCISPNGHFVAYCWKHELRIISIHENPGSNHIIATWTWHREIVGMECVGHCNALHALANCLVVMDDVGSMHCLPWPSSSLFPQSPFPHPLPKTWTECTCTTAGIFDRHGGESIAIMPILDAVWLPSNGKVVALDRITNELVVVNIRPPHRGQKTSIAMLSHLPRDSLQLTVMKDNDNLVVLWRATTPSSNTGCETLVIDVRNGLVMERHVSTSYVGRERFDDSCPFVKCRIRLQSAQKLQDGRLQLDFLGSGVISSNMPIPNSIYFPNTDEWRYVC